MEILRHHNVVEPVFTVAQEFAEKISEKWQQFRFVNGNGYFLPELIMLENFKLMWNMYLDQTSINYVLKSVANVTDFDAYL